MLVDYLANSGRWPRNLRRAVSLYHQMDVERMDAGTYALDGQNVILLIMAMEARPAHEVQYEAHGCYIDIQILLEGDECMKHLPEGSEKTVLNDWMAEKDVVFYESAGIANEIHLVPGMCAVFYPGELHKPGCISKNPATLRKAVLKVKHGWEGLEE